MSHVYTPALGLLNPTVLTGDLRAALVMENTDADTLVDAEFMDDFVSLDEYDDASYARVALTGEAFAADLANNRWEFTGDPIVFPALEAGSRQAVGLIIYLHVTNEADSKPLFFFNSASPTNFPFDGNGEDVTLTPNAEGLVQIRNAD